MSLSNNSTAVPRKRPRLPQRSAYCIFTFRLLSLLYSTTILVIVAYTLGLPTYYLSNYNATANPMLFAGSILSSLIDMFETLGIALKRETTGMRRLSPMCIVVLEILAMVLLATSFLYGTNWSSHSVDNEDHKPASTPLPSTHELPISVVAELVLLLFLT
jgi:hypothetical protein